MAELNAFIQASDRLVLLDARFKPEEQTLGSLPIFKNRIQELWDATDETYNAWLLVVNSQDTVITAAEKANIEEKYSTMFCTYALLQGRIDSLLSQLQAQIISTPVPSRAATPLPQQQIPLLLPQGAMVPGSLPPTSTLQVPTFSRAHNAEDKSQVSGLTTPAQQPSPAVEPSPFFSRFFDNSGIPYQQVPYAHRLPLPPCDIETFKGDYATWPSFRDLFTAIFVNNRRLRDVERLFHLLHRTAGDARDIVSRAPLTHEGFKIAWDQLSTRYENKRVLVNSQLKTLFNLNFIVKESATLACIFYELIASLLIIGTLFLFFIVVNVCPKPLLRNEVE